MEFQSYFLRQGFLQSEYLSPYVLFGCEILDCMPRLLLPNYQSIKFVDSAEGLC